MKKKTKEFNKKFWESPILTKQERVKINEEVRNVTLTKKFRGFWIDEIICKEK